MSWEDGAEEVVEGEGEIGRGGGRDGGKGGGRGEDGVEEN